MTVTGKKKFLINLSKNTSANI